MFNVLFVCHGNICRSAMAEYMFKDFVKKKNNPNIHIESRATSTEELGNPVYPNAKRLLNEHNIDCNGHHAKRITLSDYDKFDIIIGFDYENIRNLERMFNTKEKIYYLTDFSNKYKNMEIDDPWYTRDFKKTFDEISDSLEGLYNYIITI